MSRSAKRALLVVLVSLCWPCADAGAVTRGQLTAYVDHVAAVWAGRQDVHGAFRDPQTGRAQGGYGNVMIGYGLLRAGVRRHDERLIRAGVRGVDTALGEPVAQRGVFDLLSMATAYNFAHAHLGGNPAVAAARRRWADYLRDTGAPNIDNAARACIVAPDCFHNHEAVGATADLELLETGLRSPRPRGPLRRAALDEVGVAEPSFAPKLLSDTGSWPLAYHALSTAMLRRSVELLGSHSPAASRRALRRTVAALRGFMAPDGTVAYIGRRQEDIWSLAAAMASGDRAVADRAFKRIQAAYPLTQRGLPIVPRRGADAFSPRGVDGKPMTFNGLAIYLLNLAADTPQHGGGALGADNDGAFVDDSQNGFASVRHGNVWFAVHRRRLPPDVRNDFGLIAAKWRSPSGAWTDILRPRPMRFDAGETAGPVVERAGQRLFPAGDSIAAGRGGSVVVNGRVGLQPATFRYVPTHRGVRMTMRAQPGDVVIYTVYGPAGSTGVRRGAVSYPTGVVKSSPRPSSVQVEHNFASCCDSRMIAARMRVRPRANGMVTFTVSAHGTRRPAPAVSTASNGGGGTTWWIGPLAAIAAVLLAATVRRGSTYRRRRRRA